MAKLSKLSWDKLEAIERMKRIQTDEMAKGVHVMLETPEKYSQDFIDGYAMAIDNFSKAVQKSYAQLLVDLIPDEQITEISATPELAEEIAKYQVESLVFDYKYKNIYKEERKK